VVTRLATRGRTLVGRSLLIFYWTALDASFVQSSRFRTLERIVHPSVQ